MNSSSRPGTTAMSATSRTMRPRWHTGTALPDTRDSASSLASHLAHWSHGVGSRPDVLGGCRGRRGLRSAGHRHGKGGHPPRGRSTAGWHRHRDRPARLPAGEPDVVGPDDAARAGVRAHERSGKRDRRLADGEFTGRLADSRRTARRVVHAPPRVGCSAHRARAGGQAAVGRDPCRAAPGASSQHARGHRPRSVAAVGLLHRRRDPRDHGRGRFAQLDDSPVAGVDEGRRGLGAVRVGGHGAHRFRRHDDHAERVPLGHADGQSHAHPGVRAVQQPGHRPAVLPDRPGRLLGQRAGLDVQHPPALLLLL